jgi:tetratricopeptide (TPR) repeat protein
MKKLIIAWIFLLIPALIFAQYEPKGKVTKAQAAFDQGKIDIAKAEIDKAFEDNEKGKVTTAGKNWYLRGRIYKAIFLDSGEFKALSDDALDIAVESFNKVAEMEKESSTYALFSQQEMNVLYSAVLNEGAGAYNENDFEAAYGAFMKALKIVPGDTTALLYGGVAAQQAEMIDEALVCYQGLVDGGNANVDTYKTMVYLYRSHKEDLDKVLAVTEQALEKYPDDKEFIQEKITTLILLERVDEAEAELKAAIADDPENPMLYYQLGYLYDFQEDYDAALEQYKAALEVDPQHYESNYNAGVVYYNKGAVVLKELNELSLDEYRKNEKEYFERAKVQFEIALPYLEKAAEIKPAEDVALLETLEGIYIRLRMTDKAKEMEERIKAMNAGI